MNTRRNVIPIAGTRRRPLRSLAKSPGSAPFQQRRPYTRRQRQVLELLLSGKTLKQAADTLGLSYDYLKGISWSVRNRSGLPTLGAVLVDYALQYDQQRLIEIHQQLLAAVERDGLPPLHVAAAKFTYYLMRRLKIGGEFLKLKSEEQTTP